jgi:hypothetical protein
MRGLRIMTAYSLAVACVGILVTATNWGHSSFKAGLGIALFVSSLALSLHSYHRYLRIRQYTQ